MDKSAAYTLHIQQRYPELPIETASLNRDGQYNDVLVVNNALIFRFAKVAPAIETLRREVQLLPRLQPHISLPIPQPAFVNTESTRIGEVFMGYPLIPGQPLWREEFRAITDPAGLAHMAEQLAGFLVELHHTPYARMIPEPLTIGESRADQQRLYARIRERLYPFMRPNARQSVTDHFERFFRQMGQQSCTPVLRHGDFGTGNLLYDPETLTITGILDFSSTSPGDPAANFAGLYVSYGADFYRRCYGVYPAMAAALDRVHFYRGIFALEEALFGLENNDDGTFHSGLEEYT